MGTNDTVLQQSDLTKYDFNHLFNFILWKVCSLSSSIPTVGQGAGCFSRLLSLHSVELIIWVLLTTLTCSGIICLFFTVRVSTQTNHVLGCWQLTHGAAPPFFFHGSISVYWPGNEHSLLSFPVLNTFKFISLPPTAIASLHHLRLWAQLNLNLP